MRSLLLYYECCLVVFTVDEVRGWSGGLGERGELWVLLAWLRGGEAGGLVENAEGVAPDDLGELVNIGLGRFLKFLEG